MSDKLSDPEPALGEHIEPSPKTIALKVAGILGLVIGWSLTLGLINASGLSLGALPVLIISSPFFYGWWKLYNSPGGKVATLIFVLLIAGWALLIVFMTSS